MSSGHRAPWNLDADDELKSRTSWKRLQRSVLMGWDSNVPQRRAQVDPEEYFHEQEQAVRDRLELPHCFVEFMDALEADFRARHATDKAPILFLVAVDDADMNPRRTVELLELLRKLWHEFIVAEPPARTLDDLVRTYRSTGTRLRPVLRKILTHRLLFESLDEHMRRGNGTITSRELASFAVDGVPTRLIANSKGIWNPRAMEATLSVVSSADGP